MQSSILILEPFHDPPPPKEFHTHKQSLSTPDFSSHWQPPIYFLFQWICIFWMLHINGTTQYVTFFVWLLSMIFLRFIRVVAYIPFYCWKIFYCIWYNFKDDGCVGKRFCCYLVARSCLTLHDLMDCSPPDSSVHGISQARILEWVCEVKVAQSCLTLRPHGLYSPWNSPGQNTRVGSLSRLQGIFPNQGLNPGLPHCRWIPYQLNHKGSPEWFCCCYCC